MRRDHLERHRLATGAAKQPHTDLPDSPDPAIEALAPPAEFPAAAAPAHAKVTARDPLPVPAEVLAAYAAVIAPDVDLNTHPSNGLDIPAGDTFKLHSLAGSRYRIFLDFDGNPGITKADAAGTPWVAKPFTLDSSADFNETELGIIQRVWQKVAEYFAPFNIDVTTEDPGIDALIRTGGAEDAHGAHLVFTERPYGNTNGGEAPFNGFNSGKDNPGYVFYGSDAVDSAYTGQPNPELMARVAAHEVGHMLRVLHDGLGSDEYYNPATPNDWAPIMGTGWSYFRQWSKGEYSGATNTEDDLAIITSQNYGVTWRTDDAGDTFATATPLTGNTGFMQTVTVDIAGIISGSGSHNDVDMYSFDVVDGGYMYFRLSHGAMLVPSLKIYRDDVLFFSATPTLSGEAVETPFYNGTMQAGHYTLVIDGTGQNDPRDPSSSAPGYEYGSIGQYFLTGYFSATPPVSTAPDITSVTDDVGPGTGPVASGGVINDPTPTFRGTGVPGQMVIVYDSNLNPNDLYGSAMVDPNGHWSVTSNPMKEGTHSVLLVSFNAQNNPEISAVPFILTVDTTAPTAPTIIGPATPGAATAALVGTAEANSLVSLYDNGALLGTSRADAAGAWSLTEVSVVGAHAFTATAKDAAGNVSTAASYAGTPALVLDHTAITLTEAGGSASVTVRALNVAAGTSSLTVTLTGLDATEARASATTLVLDAAHGWSATLTLTGLDDRDVDGNQVQTLTATAAGLTAATAQVTTIDDDIAATAYRQVGSGSVNRTAFYAADGVVSTTAEKLAPGRYILDQRWSFDLSAPGDVVLHVKASGTETTKLLESTDGGATWQGLRAAGAPAKARDWDGDYLIHGVTDHLIVRLVDIRTGTDTVQDHVSVDLMTITPDHHLLGA